MSPLPEGYYPDAEESVPLFKGTTGHSNYMIGFIWAFISRFIIDISYCLLAWIVVSFFLGIACYVLWLIILIKRYQNTLNDPEINLILEKAKSKVGFNGDVQVWERDSPKLICMSSQSPMHSAILMSRTAIRDIRTSPIDGEIVLASKILGIKRIHPAIPLLGAGASFLFGALFEGSFFGGLLFSSFGDITQTSLILGLIMILLLLACIAPEISQSKTTEVHEQVESIYRIPPIVASMRVFGGQEIADSKVEEYLQHVKPKIVEEEKIESTRKQMKRFVISMGVIVVSVFVLMFGVRNLGFASFMITFIISIAFGGVAYAVLWVNDEFGFLFWNKPEDEDTLAEKQQKLLQTEYTAELEELLKKDAHFSGFRVRYYQGDDGKSHLIIFKSEMLAPRNVALDISSVLLEEIQDPGMIVPYIIYESRAESNIKKQNWFSCPLMLPGFLFLIPSVLGFSNPALFLFTGTPMDLVISLVFLFVWMAISGIAIHIWSRKSLFNLEARLAREYPAYKQALRKLVSAGFATSYLRISFQERLSALERKGF